MADGTPTNRPTAGDDVPASERPPAQVVAAAERDYRRTRARLDEVTRSVRSLLAHGWTDIEAMAYVAASLRVQQDLPATWFLAAVSIVERAKTPDPPPLDPGTTPPTDKGPDRPASGQHTG